MITTRYYYSRLNERDKKIYNAIYDGIMRYKSEVEVPGVNLSDSLVGKIYHCVLWDNPFIFSVGEYAMWHALSDDGKRIRMTTLCDNTSEKEFRRQIENTVNEFLKNTKLRDMDDFQKEVFVHDYVINNIEYDNTLGNNGSRIEPYTVYGALIEHRAVCEGIAKTVKLLLNMLDVQCIVVTGEYEGNGHSWNIVKIDGESYNLDVTMDMGRVIHPGYIRYDYFNFQTGEIPQYSIIKGFEIPNCKSTNSNYVIRAAGFVSNFDSLVHYVELCLKKRRRCMFFKANRDDNDEYSHVSFDRFKKEVERGCIEVSRKLGIHISCFIDVSGPCEIVNVEITYKL